MGRFRPGPRPKLSGGLAMEGHPATPGHLDRPRARTGSTSPLVFKGDFREPNYCPLLRFAPCFGLFPPLPIGPALGVERTERARCDRQKTADWQDDAEACGRLLSRLRHAGLVAVGCWQFGPIGSEASGRRARRPGEEDTICRDNRTMRRGGRRVVVPEGGLGKRIGSGHGRGWQGWRKMARAAIG